ncbi:hypothetical protein [Lentzea sp. NPDC092896]|uniref:hypothetical protein n=1 Tax=Lentzea sp. NPDC092896 TaxID=3364127 RepID=UPI0038069BBE
MTGQHEQNGRDDPIDALEEAVAEQTVAAAEHTAQISVAHSQRTWLPFTLAAAMLVSVLISAAVAVAVVDLYGKQTKVATDVGEVRQLAERAKEAGDTANAELERRGQQPVPIPQPGQAQDSDVLVAAATARVLAALPDTRPTSTAIATEVARYVTQNQSLFTPSPQQIMQTVAAYLEETPPPSGPPGTPGTDGAKGEKGDRGDKGDPPTQQEIQAAWVALLRDQPDVLCPRGGAFAQLRIALADGGTADTWTCVVQVQQPTTTTTTPPLLGRR